MPSVCVLYDISVSSIMYSFVCIIMNLLNSCHYNSREAVTTFLIYRIYSYYLNQLALMPHHYLHKFQWHAVLKNSYTFCNSTLTNCNSECSLCNTIIMCTSTFTSFCNSAHTFIIMYTFLFILRLMVIH